MPARTTKYDVLGLRGNAEVVGTPTVTVYRRDSADKVIEASGATVPTDADAGYAKGCRFVKTNGGVATTLYINEGSATSADFNAMETSASTVTAVVAGAGLTGGGTEGSVTVNAIAGTGITVNADSIQIAAGYTPSHIVKFAGLSASETDSDASVVISVAGVAASDIILATIQAQAGTASILKAVPTTNTITVTLSGNGGAGTIIQYAALRAVV